MSSNVDILLSSHGVALSGNGHFIITSDSDCWMAEKRSWHYIAPLHSPYWACWQLAERLWCERSCAASRSCAGLCATSARSVCWAPSPRINGVLEGFIRIIRVIGLGCTGKWIILSLLSNFHVSVLWMEMRISRRMRIVFRNVPIWLWLWWSWSQNSLALLLLLLCKGSFSGRWKCKMSTN